MEGNTITQNNNFPEKLLKNLEVQIQQKTTRQDQEKDGNKNKNGQTLHSIARK